MDQKTQHPLERITCNNSLSMLEYLIPFVDYPLKLPLALFIKFNEIRLLINAFHSTDNLVRLGLHNPSSDPIDMLCSITGMSPEMLKMLFSMMESSDGSFSPDILSGLTGATTPDFSNFANMFGGMNASQTNSAPPPNHPHSETPPPPSDSYADNSSFEQNIQNILAEYDMMQAEEFDTHNTNQRI